MGANEVMDRTWLERARRIKGLTQTEVAEAAGVSAAYYNRVERGLYTPNVVTAIKMTDCVGENVRSFLTEKPIK